MRLLLLERPCLSSTTPLSAQWDHANYQQTQAGQEGDELVLMLTYCEGLLWWKTLIVYHLLAAKKTTCHINFGHCFMIHDWSCCYIYTRDLYKCIYIRWPQTTRWGRSHQPHPLLSKVYHSHLTKKTPKDCRRHFFLTVLGCRFWCRRTRKILSFTMSSNLCLRSIL